MIKTNFLAIPAKSLRRSPSTNEIILSLNARLSRQEARQEELHEASITKAKVTELRVTGLEDQNQDLRNDVTRLRNDVTHLEEKNQDLQNSIACLEDDYQDLQLAVSGVSDN